MEKEKNKITKIIKGVIIGILSVILLINIWIVIQAKTKPNSVPSIFGYKPFIVLSGSMETKIHVGDLVFVKVVDPSTLNENDIIAFRDHENLVTTHRIINIVNTDRGKCFETKGDNNNAKDDNIVCKDNVEGLYVSRIAKLGSAILFIQEPLGFTVMMLSILLICIFIYWISNRNNKNKISEEELKEFEEFKKAKASKKKD